MFKRKLDQFGVIISIASSCPNLMLNKQEICCVIERSGTELVEEETDRLEFYSYGTYTRVTSFPAGLCL